MKHKFSSMGRVAIALVLALSLVLVMGVPVSAAVSQPEVTLDDAAPGATAIYTIKFTTNEDLAVGDGIVIEFPEGTLDLGAIGDSADDITGVTEANVDNVGQRLSIVLGADIEAGDITLVVGGTNKLTNPVDSDYTLDVYTNQEPTAVTSETYVISLAVSTPGVSLDIHTVATAATYTITFTTYEILAMTEDIVIEFPVDTDISAVVKDDVTVAGATVSAATPVGQVLTITMASSLAADPQTVTIADIINPTTVLNPDPDAATWTLTMHTSYGHRISAVSDPYTLDESTAAADIAKLVIKDVDSYISNNTVSDAMTFETQDEYGNVTPTDLEGDDIVINLSATPSGGVFRDTGDTEDITSVKILAGDSSSEGFIFKSATAGPYTITASESPAATPDWTDGTAQVLVNPELELWGGGELKDSYATFALAIAAALPYDTIRFAPSTYDGGFAIHDKPYLTLESTGTAAETILALGPTDLDILFVSATGVTIDGFTFKGLKGMGEDAVNGIDVTSSGFTIKNNTFVDIYFDNIFVNSSDPLVDITSGLIDNNTLIGMGELSASYRSGLSVESGEADISGVKITNNTLSAFSRDDVNAIGVSKEGGGDVSAITIQDNIISDSYRGISICGDVTGMIGTKAISNNSITGCTAGFKASWGNNVEFDLVNNTITGNTLYGVWLHDATPNAQNVTIKYNDLSGNGEWGIYNAWVADGNDVVAKYNWWGDISGPSAGTGAYASTAVGSGVAVSVEVVYDLWLNASGGTPLETHTINLVVGWNLISLPLIPNNSTIETVLADLIAGETIEQVRTYDQGIWPSWARTGTPPTNLLTDMEDGPGFWVLMSAVDALVVVGSEHAPPGGMQRSYDLYEGWNLIGFTSLSTAVTATNYLDELSTVMQAIYGYDTELGVYFIPREENEPPLPDYLEPGHGYWVAVSDGGMIYP